MTQRAVQSLFLRYFWTRRTKSNDVKGRDSFGSRLGIILATAGSAVGLGNIWRFPYMTGQNGGAAFIVIYCAFVIALGLPGMIAEFIVGRHGEANAARAYRNMSGGGLWSAIGYIGVFTSIIILGFYAVVAGWCLHYLYAAIAMKISGDAAYVQNYFATFAADPVKPVALTIIFILLTHCIVRGGIQRGIERASKVLMPILFVLLIVIGVASCLLPGAEKGIEFLFKPDFSKITKDTLLEALGQAFFSLSLGTACLCTYASYFSKKINLGKSALQIAGIDTLIAVLAGLMIFPAAFSVGVEPDSGPSLIFITLPNVFARAFGDMPTVGYLISILFYSLLSLAALTSTISMHEIGTAFFCEELSLSRSRGAWFETLACIVVGIFCALSYGAVDGMTLFGMPVLDFCDMLTAQILLPLGSLLTTIFIGWFVPKYVVRNEFTNNGKVATRVYPIFLFAVRFICPLGIVMIFLHQLGLL